MTARDHELRATLPHALARWTVADRSGCWTWRGPCSLDGYPRVRLGGRWKWAHRAAYAAVRGPIPAGWHLDHLCRVRACVRPDHLEPVTPAENRARVGLPPFERAYLP